MKSLNNLMPWAPLVARVLVGGMFIMAGWSKVTGFDATVAYATSAGLPAPEFAIMIAIVIEILAGLSVLLGYKIVWGSLALVVFTLVASVLFNADFSDQEQATLFMKNMGIVAALLYMARFGGGKMTIEK